MCEQNLDYLTINDGDKQVLSNIKDMANHLKELQFAVVEAELSLKEAKRKYDEYRMKVLPTAMLSAGIYSLSLEDGSSIIIKNKFYCNPNKNDEDRKVIGEWLKAHGGEHLIERTAVIDEAHINDIKDIPHTEKWDMNTNRLKAWIKSQLGIDGGVANISIQDIPNCIHFTQVDEVEIDAK